MNERKISDDRAIGVDRKNIDRTISVDKTWGVSRLRLERGGE
jgi:hypothetical protein